MKHFLILLFISNIFLNTLACKYPPNCNPRGSFCSLWNLNDCCCYDGCLLYGLGFAGQCHGTTKTMGTYQIETLGTVNVTITNESGGTLYNKLEFVNENKKNNFNFLQKPVFNETVFVNGNYDVTLRIYDGKTTEYIHNENYFHYKIPKNSQLTTA